MVEKLLRLQEVPLSYRDTRTGVDVLHVHDGTKKDSYWLVCTRCRSHKTVENYWAQK